MFGGLMKVKGCNFVVRDIKGTFVLKIKAFCLVEDFIERFLCDLFCFGWVKVLLFV